ncbi:hypothetical protein CAL12_16485 [Bordetella genomosp. 8]|uniref:DUF72 domain-containing protein n=1 Tax=Bordetella genomosp. 8 TaxID=1416806 RepID=A0A1W6YMG5_9BORD|nr:DUF72 domain-containing protein [Bordetella genomosp. 8]ARP82255.1 hypothetical protein CAL12_16485 [Bordetella genomosp. 8]
MKISESLALASSPTLVGCAGWSLSSQDQGTFASEGSHLERYARVFPCVEINSSFYRSHQAQTYARWADSVPDAFRFSVKLPRTITHDARLQRCEGLLRAFLDEVAALEKKLGCILIQLPPSLALEARQAGRFLSVLRRHTSVPVACEPRHPSWFTPRGADLLRGAQVACVRAHPSPVPGADPVGDPSLFYIRLHGAPDMYYSAYDETFIQAVAARVDEARAQHRLVWCIFDNTARGAAIPNALALMRSLSTRPRPT